LGVARDAERLARLRAGAGEELDELHPLRSRAPRAVAIVVAGRPAALPAHVHLRLLAAERTTRAAAEPDTSARQRDGRGQTLQARLTDGRGRFGPAGSDLRDLRLLDAVRVERDGEHLGLDPLGVALDQVGVRRRERDLD